MGSRLQLDTSVLKEKEQNYTSLTELNNIRLFTDDFEAAIEKEKRITAEQNNRLIGSCFTADNEEDTTDTIVNNIFQTSQKVVVEENSQIKDYSHYFIFFGSILIGLIICILVFEITNRRKMDRNDIDIDNRTK